MLNNQRTAWIDVLKGIAIIFVVLGHHPYLTQLPDKVFNIIFSFHIPLFFFISGYLFNPDVTFGYLIKKRFNSLLRPYFFTLIIICGLYYIVKREPSFLWYVFWIIYGNGPNLPKAMLHLWFLPHLFLISLFAWLLLRYINKLKTNGFWQLSLLIAMLLAGFYTLHLFWNVKVPTTVTNYFINDGNLFLINGLLDNPSYAKSTLLQDGHFVMNGLPWSIDISLLSSVFFLSGYLLKKNSFEKIFFNRPTAIFFCVTIIVCHTFCDFTIDLAQRRYDSLLFSTLAAYTAIFILITTSLYIVQTNSMILNILSYLGKYSLIIFIFHSVVQSKVYFTLLSRFSSHSVLLAIPIAFVAAICIPLCFNWLLLERLKIFRYWYYSKPS